MFFIYSNSCNSLWFSTIRPPKIRKTPAKSLRETEQKKKKEESKLAELSVLAEALMRRLGRILKRVLSLSYQQRRLGLEEPKNGGFIFTSSKTILSLSNSAASQHSSLLKPFPVSTLQSGKWNHFQGSLFGQFAFVIY